MLHLKIYLLHQIKIIYFIIILFCSILIGTRILIHVLICIMFIYYIETQRIKIVISNYHHGITYINIILYSTYIAVDTIFLNEHFLL